MTFNYLPGDPTTLMDIRAAIGDVDSSRAIGQRLEDEEILRAVTRYGTGVRATLDCVRQLKARLSSLITMKQAGNLRLEWAQSRYQALASLERDLERTAALGAVAYAGGISQGDKGADEANTDRVAPAFVRGTLDNPEAGSQAEPVQSTVSP